ncbi:MAG: hypothetical protein JSW55_14115 [Chloroflexota bacterium]|nr:MAG: hypothetical protein JSW55_14115 [Chloroflexota bacterium]
MNRRVAVIVILAAILLVGSVVAAQHGEFKIPWHRVAGGGGTSVDGDRFALSGTIGQAEAGESSDGTAFVLRGGYWHASGSGPDEVKLFVPLVLRPE